MRSGHDDEEIAAKSVDSPIAPKRRRGNGHQRAIILLHFLEFAAPTFGEVICCGDFQALATMTLIVFEVRFYSRM